MNSTTMKEIKLNDITNIPVSISTPIVGKKPYTNFGNITPITNRMQSNKKCKKSINFKESHEVSHLDLLEDDDSCLEAINLDFIEKNFSSNASEKEENKENISFGSEDSVSENAGDWQNETLLEQVVRETDISSQRSVCLADRIREALLSNAHKSVTSCSRTFLNITKEKNGSDSNSFSLGPFFDLPLDVKLLIQETKGITELYAWQEECLKLSAIRERRNLVYALPTSGGKTLVAEILILREILCRKHNVLLVLPYVAIVQEKVRSLSPIAVALNFLLEEYAASKGKYPPRKRRWKNVLFIATIEKALSLVSSLIETNRLEELGLVVVDELHLLGESGGRGAHLEILLTKLLYAAADKIHIVGMSATIGNLHEVATFLRAESYINNFRPVELKEYIKFENQIYSINWDSANFENMINFERKINTPLPKIDPDHVGSLVLEVVPKDSVLVFCPSKKNCENVALVICEVLPREFQNHKLEERKALYRALLSENGGSMCPVLKKTLPFGVAYHHSGLTTDERRLLEDAFLAGTLCCICCTSTLAAGVNLPARRVILRSPYIGTEFINISRYKQMVGRAGRAGMGTTGESFLICVRPDNQKVQGLLQSTMDSCESSLLENEYNGVRSLVLSAVMQGLASTRTMLYKLVNCTLLHVQAQRRGVDMKVVTDDAVEYLLKIGALCYKDKGLDAPPEIKNDSNMAEINLHHEPCLAVSRLGMAAIKGSMDLKKAQVLYEDLKNAQKSLVLLNYLHLLFLVTPYEFIDKVKPNSNVYYSVYNSLGVQEQQVARVIGINEACMVRIARGQSCKNVSESVVARFYLTLMLYELWHQKEISEVAFKYQVDRGFVQNLVVSASSFAACVVRFCEELDDMWAFRDLYTTFSQRLSYCCTQELIPLMELPSVKRGRAKQLYNAGFKTLQDVANSNVKALVTSIEHLSRKVANQIIAAAKMLLLEKVESLREEAEEVLEGIAAAHL